MTRPHNFASAKFSYWTKLNMSDANPEQNPQIPVATLRPATLLRYTDEGYSAPTWEDVRTLIGITGLSNSAMGDIAGISARKFRKWACSPESNDHLPIPYAVWRLLLLETGFVALDQQRGISDTPKRNRRFRAGFFTWSGQIRLFARARKSPGTNKQPKQP